MIRFSKSVMQNSAKVLNKNLKEGKGYLNSIQMKDTDGKLRTLTKPQYMGLYEAQNVFIIKHGRFPNYTGLNSTANNPLALDYQDNGYTCCPTSLSMASQMLFNYKSEKECARVLGTITGQGTSPAKLVANAPKLGFTATQISRNINSVKNSLAKGFPVVSHIQTKNASCLGYTGDYGHYILIYGTNDNQYKIADPTKGIKLCKSTILDKATNGRNIHYYSIKPK